MDTNLPQPPIPPQVPMQKKKPNIGIIVGILALVGIIVSGWFYVMQTQDATVSGFINFTALKPDPNDQGQIVLKYRKYGSNAAYQTIKFQPQLQDIAPWTWNGAQNGQPYEVLAELHVEDELITTSEPLVVTAPAINQELALRVTWHDLPADVVQQQKTSIKGHTIINGLIPEDSTLIIQAKASDQDTFATIETLNAPSNDNVWEWDEVTPLKDYSLKAILVSNATIIGTADTITAAGGDNEIEFMINSQAKPNPTPTMQPTAAPTPIVTKAVATATPTPTPAPATGKISGKIQINGPKAANTSVILSWRKPGQGDFQRITQINYPKQDGQNWEWDNVAVGNNYEVMAELQVNNTTTATARSQVVASPAENVDFILNTGVTVPTVSSTPSLAACTNNADNKWDATIQFPDITNAGNYWLKVGTNPSAADSFNNKQRAESNADKQQITVRVDSKKSYYAQYAYSLCVNCSSDKNFSNFSNTFQFSCGNDDPPPAYTGYKCNTGSYTCEATTDANAPYAYNNTGLAQCQLACKAAPTATPVPTATPIPTATPTPTNIPIITLPVEMGPSPR